MNSTDQTTTETATSENVAINQTWESNDTNSNSQPESVDVAFSVPQIHRLRFTHDLSGADFKVLLDVLQAGHAGPPKVCVVVDRDVAAAGSFTHSIAQRLRQTDLVDLIGHVDGSPVACVLDGGESVKNDDVAVNEVLRMIHQNNLDRRSYLVVIGGGAILDAVGYAAAIAHRGIRLVRIPSTTLSQDDSGVGVKNAINQFGKKNWIGTFAVPWAVINDLSILRTLPDREFRNGFSEAVKVSLLKSRRDFDFLCSNAAAIRGRDNDVAFEVIKRSCRWHLNHITQGGDPFEALEARPLDFGHWSAHRIEPMSDYKLRHGEAVGIGVALDCIYSSMVHGLPRESAMAVCRCMHDLGLSLWHKTLEDADAVLDGLEEFRQHLGGRLTITMLNDVADPIDVHEIDRDAMSAAIKILHTIEKQFGGENLGDDVWV